MNTARDLALLALSRPPERSVERADLSLALAGAEAADLLGNGSLALDGDRMAPRSAAPTGDRLLDQALASIVRQPSWQTVQNWLWRRARELAETYAEDLDRAGLLTRPRGHLLRPRSARTVPADAPELRRARKRLASGDPVLAALAALLGIGAFPPDGGDWDGDASVTTVLASVGDAVTELKAERLRRGVEDQAFDSIWRV